MECWAHNLFPKMNFDDCLDKIEKLGRKRLVQVFLGGFLIRSLFLKATMKRLRPGFSQTEDDEEIVEDENVEKDEVNFSIFKRFLTKNFLEKYFGNFGHFMDPLLCLFAIFPCMAREATSSHM